MEYIYEGKHYAVVLLDPPIFDETEDMPPLSYGVVNKEFGVTETYASFYPGAVQTAQGLDEKMEEILPTPPPLIQLPRVAIP